MISIVLTCFINRLANETEAACVRTQADVKKKLQQRLDDIRFWKKELDDKLDALRKENEMLDAYRVRVEKVQPSVFCFICIACYIVCPFVLFVYLFVCHRKLYFMMFFSFIDIV